MIDDASWLIMVFLLLLLWWLGLFFVARNLLISLLQQRLKPLLHSLYLLLALLFKFLVNGCHVFGDLLLLQLLQSSQSLQVLLLRHFPREDITHYFLLILLEGVEGLAKLEDGHCAVLVSDGCVLAAHNLIAATHVADFNAGKGRVRDFMGEGNFVLAIVVVPYIEPAVLSGEEEDSHPRGGEAAVTQIAGVVSCFHEGSPEVVHPDLGAPVSHRHEDLRELEVPRDGVDWAQMPVLQAEPRVDFNWLFQLLVGHDDRSLLSPYYELTGGFGAVLQSGSADHHFLSLRVIVRDLEGLHSILLQLSRIPEVGETISGD